MRSAIRCRRHAVQGQGCERNAEKAVESSNSCRKGNLAASLRLQMPTLQVPALQGMASLLPLV